ncbi:MAG: hypothetical protein RIG61_11560 [Deltaproteobacteria bacterium]
MRISNALWNPHAFLLADYIKSWKREKEYISVTDAHPRVELRRDRK